MKKMRIMCMTVMCMTASDFFASPVYTGWDYFEKVTEEGVDRLHNEFKDAETLERYMRMFFRGKIFPCDIPLKFKRRFGVSDEVMQAALMSIIRECSAKAGWKIIEGERVDDSVVMSKWLLDSAIVWLGACADTEAKRFLLDIATDHTTHIMYRRGIAVRAYLCSADAQDARDVLVRFLIGDMRATMDPGHYVYAGAMQAYDEAEEYPLKREAIVASLVVALAREDNKERFTDIDKELAKRSKEYAESSQRKVMIQGMDARPPSIAFGAEDTLKVARDFLQSRKTFTSISTNLTELMARDFSKPPEKPQ